MANILIGAPGPTRAVDPPARPTKITQWPQWMVFAATGAQKVFPSPEAVPDGWVTKDEYRANQHVKSISGADMVKVVQATVPPLEPMVDTVRVEPDRKALVAEAKALGLKFFAGIKAEDLAAKIAKAKAGK